MGHIFAHEGNRTPFSSLKGMCITIGPHVPGGDHTVKIKNTVQWYGWAVISLEVIYLIFN